MYKQIQNNKKMGKQPDNKKLLLNDFKEQLNVSFNNIKIFNNFHRKNRGSYVKIIELGLAMHTAASLAKIAITIFVSNKSLPFIEIYLFASLFDSLFYVREIFTINSARKMQ